MLASYYSHNVGTGSAFRQEGVKESNKMFTAAGLGQPVQALRALHSALPT
jgi:hypothetical protein